MQYLCSHISISIDVYCILTKNSLVEDTEKPAVVLDFTWKRDKIQNIINSTCYDV